MTRPHVFADTFNTMTEKVDTISLKDAANSLMVPANSNTLIESVE